METQEVLELVDAAARLKVPYHTAHRFVLIGDLKGERRAGRWYVDRADLERLLKERQNDRVSEPA